MLTLILSLYIAPYTKALSQELISIDSFEEQIESMKPDKLYVLEGGRAFIYAKDVNEDVLSEIKLLTSDENGSSLVVADQLQISKNKSKLKLDFKDGIFYKGVFSDQKQVTSSFKSFISPIERDMRQSGGA